MARRYSRLARLEEKKNIKRAVGFGVLTVGIIVIFIFFGLPLVARFVGFITDLRKGGSPVQIEDTTPPAPPIFERFQEYTNEDKLKISGKTEPGATVILFLNNDDEEVVANKDGEFSYNFKLRKGENTISAKAKDEAGNESQESKIYDVVFDNEAPDLEITSPEEGQEFFGSKERQITIEGITDEDASLTINDRVVAVDEDGTFAFLTTLGEGENNFNIKSTDKAGNQTEMDFKVSFTP
jgi:hypothetical protein